MITKAALLLFREHNGQRQLMFVRAHGKSYYVFPGGKQEAGETIEQVLARELEEELGCRAVDIKNIGQVNGHTPDGRDMAMHLFRGKLIGEPRPQAEIAEIAWFSQPEIQSHKEAMTPMTLKHVLPHLLNHKLW